MSTEKIDLTVNGNGWFVSIGTGRSINFHGLTLQQADELVRLIREGAEPSEALTTVQETMVGTQDFQEERLAAYRMDHHPAGW